MQPPDGGGKARDEHHQPVERRQNSEVNIALSTPATIKATNKLTSVKTHYSRRGAQPMDTAYCRQAVRYHSTRVLPSDVSAHGQAAVGYVDAARTVGRLVRRQEDRQVADLLVRLGAPSAPRRWPAPPPGHRARVARSPTLSSGCRWDHSIQLNRHRLHQATTRACWFYAATLGMPTKPAIDANVMIVPAPAPLGLQREEAVPFPDLQHGPALERGVAVRCEPAGKASHRARP